MTIPFLLSLALRVAILGGVAACVRGMRRRASASEHHLVWMLAIGSMLLLLLAATVLPAIELFTLPAAASPISSGVAQDSRVSGLNWSMIIGVTWLTGTVVCLISLISAHARARGIVRRASHNATSSRAIGRTVVVSGESAFAFNYGTRAPTIVLPADAVDWPGALLHATLVHEAAHIARRDSLSLLVSQLARVVYWWHPAVWFATREAAAERERACDDAVLRDGCRPSEYGEHLLATGTRRHVVPIAPAASLFSHTDGLARRISSLLDDGVDHRPVRRRAASASLIIALPVLAVTASATPMPRPLSAAIDTLSLAPIVAQAPSTLPAPAPRSPVRKKPKPDRNRKPEAPATDAKTPPDALDKMLAKGTWVVDGRVVDAASFPVDVKEMARLAVNMSRLAGKVTITIDSAKMGTTR